MRTVVCSLLPFAPVAAATILATLSLPSRAGAEDSEEVASKAERCATRLAAVMTGEAASADLLASKDPQSAFETLVKDARFVERFSGFINSQFSRSPGGTPAEDAPYYMTRHVLTNNLPWSEMFVGKFDVRPKDPMQPDSEAIVTANPDGLGYFRSRQWAVRYAGNEPDGIRIVAANQILQNTVGVKLLAVTSAPGDDVSATGRKSPGCAGCHYTPWYALDRVASVLGKKEGMGDKITFKPPSGDPQSILGGVQVTNDRQLVEALVGNEAFSFNSCRLAYKFLYARNEMSCDGPVFDNCVDAFKKDGLITSAIKSIAKAPTFCE